MSERPGLTGIYIGSGVSARTREPFCHVTVQATDGRFVEGQLDPETVRSMAYGWLEAAEAAIHDAAVFKLMTTKMDLPEGSAAAFIDDLRNYRQDADRMTDAPES